MATPRTLPSSPVKKNHQFYSAHGNLWNHVPLTCAKVARFYHLPQAQFYHSHPSPQQLSDMDNFEKTQKASQKTTLERAHAAERLQRRRIERMAVKITQLQTRSRQQCASLSIPRSELESPVNRSRLNLTIIRPEPPSQLNTNLWANINFLPANQLRKHISPKEIALDATAVEDLSGRRDLWRTSLQQHAEQLRELQGESRRGLAKRHEEVEAVSAM